MGVCSPVIGFVQPAATFLAAGIADKRSFIQFRPMIAAGSEVITMGVTVIAELTHPFADWSISATDVLFLTVFHQGAFVFRFIEMVMFLKDAALFDLFGDCSWVFSQLQSDTAQGSPLV